MNDKLLERCQLLVDNRLAIQSAFPWENSMMHLCTATIYTLHGLRADTDRLRDARQLIRSSVGAFNNFRSTSELALAAMLDVTGDPASILDRALNVYALLKTHFFTSTYLPMSAVTIAQHVPVSHFDEIAAATRSIYERIRKEHPFLTGSDDCAYCTLFALSGQEQDTLIEGMEAAYHELDGMSIGLNEKQALSHALSLYPGDPIVKAQRTIDFRRKLRERSGHRVGMGFAPAMLGVIAMTSENPDFIIDEILDAAEWLRHQKGFGFWSSVDRSSRMMYAGMLVNAVMAADSNTNMTSMTINSAIAAIIAQQAATSAAIAASSSH